MQTTGQTRHVLIIGGCLQATSRGIAGMVRGTIRSVYSVNPEAVISVFGVRQSRYQQPDVQIAIDNERSVHEYLIFRRHYPALLLKAMLSRLLPGPLRQRFQASNPVLVAYAQADLVLDLTVGDSFSDIYGYYHAYQHYLDKLIAVIYGCPLVFMPQTIGPFKRPFSRFLARWIMRRARLVCTREPYSTETVKKLLGDDPRVVQLADMAFLMLPEPGMEVSRFPESPLVGVNVSGLLYGQPKAARVLSGGCDYSELLQQVVKHLVADYHARILLVPHDYEYQLGDSGDLGACRALYRDLDSTIQSQVTVLEGNLSAPAVKGTIGKCDFFVGSRLHSCIAALSMRVPVIALGYSYKYQGIMQGLGMEQLVANLASDSLEASLAKILKAFDERQTIRARLQKTVPLIEAKANSCATLLQDQGLL